MAALLSDLAYSGAESSSDYSLFFDALHAYRADNASSLYGARDLGGNGQRIEQFLLGLDDAVTRLLRDSPESPAAEETEEPASVPVPWAPSPDRPKRTPPPSRKPPSSSGAALPGRDAPAGEAATRLTAEEMSALLGDAPGGASTLRERHGG